MHAIIASLFGNSGRFEMSSFHGLSRGMICIEASTASASGVLNSKGALTASSGPNARPSWLVRSPASTKGLQTVSHKMPIRMRRDCQYAATAQAHYL